jgi:hypothetical protein
VSKSSLFPVLSIVAKLSQKYFLLDGEEFVLYNPVRYESEKRTGIFGQSELSLF